MRGDLCPRCGYDIAPGQEYCLTCGGRIPGHGAVVSPGETGRTWMLRAGAALVIAAVGAALAVAVGGGQAGWTIALATIPQTKGRQVAVTRARRARGTGLSAVGILDSSLFASLHPGYWIVFSGIYASEAEATSALERARKFTRAATVRHVVP
jgi:hypothetical protein